MCFKLKLKAQICLYGQKINGTECELWLCVVPGAVSCFGMSGLIPNSVCYLEDNYLRVVGKGELDIYEAGNPEGGRVAISPNRAGGRMVWEM